MKTKTLIALAIAGAFAVPFSMQASAGGDRIILAQASGAAPGTGPGVAPTSLQQLDVDRDGYVSREEAMKDERLHAGFDGMDKDRDGRLSSGEMDGWQVRAGGPGIGGIQDRSMHGRFDEFDKDKDGRLSRSEWDTMWATGSAATGGNTPPAGGPGVGGPAAKKSGPTGSSGSK